MSAEDGTKEVPRAAKETKETKAAAEAAEAAASAAEPSATTGPAPSQRMWKWMNFANPGVPSALVSAPQVQGIAEVVNPEATNLYRIISLTNPFVVREYLKLAAVANASESSDPDTVAYNIAENMDDLEATLRRLGVDTSATTDGQQGGGVFGMFSGTELARSLRTGVSDKIVMIVTAVLVRYMCMAFIYESIQSGFVTSLGMATIVYSAMYACVMVVVVILASTTGSQMLAEVLYGFNMNIYGRVWVNFIPVALQLVLGLVPATVPGADVGISESESTFDVRYALYKRFAVFTGISTLGAIMAIARFG